MSGLFDASQLTAFGDALLAKGVARRALISASVKKGAQNVKNSIRDDLNGSGNAAFRRIPITYTVSEGAGRITAEIGPTKGGAGSLANIAFFGTARGGGTHRFYEHGEEELPKLAEYAARQIGSITHRELQAFISGKAETLAPSTVLKIVGVLKGICDLAIKNRLIAKAPTDDLALPRREGRRLHRYLTVEQLLAVADEAGRARIQPTDRKALVLVLGLCGLRWGEMCGLRVEDVDYGRRRIHVRRNVTRIGSEWSETSPKSHEMRDVPMPSIVGEALLPVLAGKGPSDWVFRDHLGRPPRNQSAAGAKSNRTWFISACRRAGIESLPPHDLRHTAASIAVHAGANIKALQRMLGHKSAAMTLDVYADLFDSDLDDVARTIDAAVQVASQDVGKMWAQVDAVHVRNV